MAARTVTLGTGIAPPYQDPADFFISKTGDNTDGRSWATAWNELNQVDWNAVQPGDVVAIDGGTVKLDYPYGYDFVSHATAQPALTGGMVYTTTLRPTQFGTEEAPIVVRASREPGRDGTIVLFGGRYSLLPEAGSSGYVQSGVGRPDWPLDFRAAVGVIVDGLRRSGIMIYGYGGDSGTVANYDVNHQTNAGGGTFFGSATQFCTLRNVEIFDCGNFARVTVDDTYRTDHPGVRFGGTGNRLERLVVHDCGQDTLQAGSAIYDARIVDSWFYFGRLHSVWSGYGFNGGAQTITNQNTTHVDAIQAYFGGEHLGPIHFEHCIFGPNVNQGIYLGDATTANHTTYDDVSAVNCLFVGIHSHPLKADYNAGSVYPANWLVDRCTVHRYPLPSPGYSGFAKVDMDGVAGSNHIIRNSIFAYGGYWAATAGMLTSSCVNNFWSDTYNSVSYPFSTAAVTGGTNLNPNFVTPLPSNTPSWAQYLAMDVTPQNATVAASGAGSDLRRIGDLLDRIDMLNGT